MNIRSTFAFRYAGFSIALCMLTGCATGPRATQAFQPLQASTDKAVVYVYMKPGVVGAANSWDIFANHQNIGVMHNGAYIAHAASPGKLTLGSRFRPSFGGVIEGLTSTEKDSLVLDLAPGSTRYATVHVGFMGPAFGRSIVEVERSRAETEIQRCKRAESAY